ncbi:uncharacterized protein BDV14DRAFT_171644 [Aspergillus stella-maris]|uniref:uncharacterized protein n=1 Tax=Aspergillus stella-maris TaxID=1810926 RepID=UPI003CCD562F
MTPLKIFFTGASGYIGGDVLHTILSSHPTWEKNITLLLRNPSYTSRFKAVYPSIHIFIADHDDKSAIANEVSKHDIVMHFALSADHISSAEGIVEGLTRRGGGVYVHTSGTDVLLNPDEKIALNAAGGGKGDEKGVRVFDDWDGIQELRELPDAAAHREVDNLVLSSGTATLKTAIICPSTVYGVGRGLISQRSDQIPNLAKFILQMGKGLQLADGKSFWNCVHVYDLSRLYLALLDDIVASTSTTENSGDHGAEYAGKATFNTSGYYLVESGTYHWGDIARRITQEAHKLGLIPSEEVSIIDMSDRDILRPAGRPVINYSVAAKAVRARRLLGWDPVEGALEGEVNAIVRAEGSALSLEIMS